MTPLSQGQAEPTDAKAKQSFEHRMLHFGWRDFTGRLDGTPRCWYYDNSDLNARWVGWRECARLAASSAAPTADLRAAIEALPCHIQAGFNADAQIGYMRGHRDARLAAAQLAAVAAPEARIEGQSLVHPAAPGSSTPSAAPLSEPCALDQGARPVRMLTEEEMQTAYALDYDDEQFADRDPTWLDRMHAAINRFCEVNGIAPPVDQQEGGAQ